MIHALIRIILILRCLLDIYLSVIETLICHIEIELNKVCFLRFCTKYDA